MLAGSLADPERGVRSRGKRGPEEAGTRSHEMTRYLISFDDGAMTFPEEELPAVAMAAHQVVREAKNAGVWIFGGFSVVDVPSREEALDWAAKIAVACRCAQEVREIMDDPES